MERPKLTKDFMLESEVNQLVSDSIQSNKEDRTEEWNGDDSCSWRHLEQWPLFFIHTRFEWMVGLQGSQGCRRKRARKTVDETRVHYPEANR